MKRSIIWVFDRFALAAFWLIRRVPLAAAREQLLRGTAAVVRVIPDNRVKGFCVEHSLQLRGQPMRFTFHSRRLGIDWAADGFPDLLARHMLFEGMYQQDALIALRSHIQPGDTVLDVGGHHGLMAVVAGLAAGQGGRVVTFEPNPRARTLLEGHLRLNGLDNVSVESIALSDSPGEASFFVQHGDVTWNSTLVPDFADGDRFGETITVQTDTLDNYVAAAGLAPAVVKIDVEGAEFLVLEGARGTIDRHRPALIMEFNPASAEAAGHALEDYVALLRDRSYQLTVLRRDARGFYRAGDEEPFDVVRHTADGELVNVICVPAERPGPA